MRLQLGQNLTDEWVSFPGGELEGRRARVLCTGCRQARNDGAFGSEQRQSSRTLCFQCYRAGLEHDRRIRAAGLLDTASEARFQTTLPFEPVNVQRLEALKADREAAREQARQGTGSYTDRRRRAQIAARHALQQIFAGVKARQAKVSDAERVIASAVHAAELQLPEAWLPFVVSR